MSEPMAAPNSCPEPETAPLLSVSGLKTWFPIRGGVFSRTRGHVKAVDGVSFELAPGSVLGLVGESGCGKSTLARTILRLETAREGRIAFEGLDLLALRGAALRRVRRHLQPVFQDPLDSLNPRMTVLDTLTEAPIEHGLIRDRDKRDCAVALLREVELREDALNRYPHEFSGGQRQRIGIARALSLRPRLIVCDEAVSALDVSVRAQVVNLLMALRRTHALAYLFISHDLSIVHHVADRIAVMYLGRIVESGPATPLISDPIHPYTRALISAAPLPYKDRSKRIILEGDVPSPVSPPPGCSFHPRCPHVRPYCRETVPELLPFGEDRLVACLRAAERPGVLTM